MFNPKEARKLKAKRRRVPSLEKVHDHADKYSSSGQMKTSHVRRESRHRIKSLFIAFVNFVDYGEILNQSNDDHDGRTFGISK